MTPHPPRTALVTGASAGLGVAIARALGALGWNVAVGARRTERLEQTAREIEEVGGRAFAHALDVADAASVERFFDATESALGPPDVVVNNAGLSYPGLAHDQKPEDLAHEVAVNLIGPMLVTRRALPSMRAARRGDVVFITSDASVHPRPQQSTYTATKAGLEGYHRALQLELEGTGVRSTVVRPGPAISEYAAAWDHTRIPALLEYWRRFGLQRHLGVMAPEAVARAVVVAVTSPPGVIFDVIEVQPQAPIET